DNYTLHGYRDVAPVLPGKRIKLLIEQGFLLMKPWLITRLDFALIEQRYIERTLFNFMRIINPRTSEGAFDIIFGQVEFCKGHFYSILFPQNVNLCYTKAIAGILGYVSPTPFYRYLRNRDECP